MSFYIDGRDERYPERLAGVRLSPTGIWARADRDIAEILAEPTVAIVGARSCSDYGAHVAREFARDLAREGVVIVSGLARGVDGHAHRGAIEGDGVTVAVLGCGIDRDYPIAHHELARAIVRHGGAILSEYEPGEQVAPWRLMARNLIIAALADIVVVVEARADGGSMVTADAALAQGKIVMAVPGQITSPLSAGTNRLLTVDGVLPCLSAAEILRTLDDLKGRLFT